MSQLIARISVLAMLVVISVTTMIYGWGLTPRSWLWIVGMGFVGNALVIIINHYLDKETKP